MSYNAGAELSTFIEVCLETERKELGLCQCMVYPPAYPLVSDDRFCA